VIYVISKNDLENILCKYPELIDPELTLKGRNVNVLNQAVDILYEDKYDKKLAVQVRIAPIEKEHVGEIISHQEEIISGEVTDVSVMLVSDKVPEHLQTMLKHSGVAWKEINHFQIKEHLQKKNDAELLALFE
jgi:RecB family endonuclease NucS